MPSFKVCDVTPAPNSLESLQPLRYLKHIFPDGCSMLYHTQPPHPVRSEYRNSFLGAYYAAYAEHRNLILRPDDVWLSIALTFANFMSYFESEKPKIELRIFLDNWVDAIHRVGAQIQEKSNQDLYTWITPNFSTTTDKDRIVAGIALMGAMKGYFSYHFRTLCGIPSVTLLGTLEDWLKIKQKVQELPKNHLEFAEWVKILVPIIEEIILSYQGRSDNSSGIRDCIIIMKVE